MTGAAVTTTQVPWRVQVIRNHKKLRFIASKRLSEPTLSTRTNRKDPSLAAQIATARLSATSNAPNSLREYRMATRMTVTKVTDPTRSKKRSDCIFQATPNPIHCKETATRAATTIGGTVNRSHAPADPPSATSDISARPINMPSKQVFLFTRYLSRFG